MYHVFRLIKQDNYFQVTIDHLKVIDIFEAAGAVANNLTKFTHVKLTDSVFKIGKYFTSIFTKISSQTFSAEKNQKLAPTPSCLLVKLKVCPLVISSSRTVLKLLNALTPRANVIK